MKNKPGILKQFLLSFSGLKEGKHEFEFDIQKTFFESFDYSEITNSSLIADVILEKSSSMLTLDINIYGSAEVICDRCDDPLQLPLSIRQELYVKFGQGDFNQTDDVVILPENAYEIDISHYIYEFTCLAMPEKRVHAEGECNPEVIKTLKEFSVNQENHQPDPRWDKLKRWSNK